MIRNLIQLMQEGTAVVDVLRVASLQDVVIKFANYHVRRPMSVDLFWRGGPLARLGWTVEIFCGITIQQSLTGCKATFVGGFEMLCGYEEASEWRLAKYA